MNAVEGTFRTHQDLLHGGVGGTSNCSLQTLGGTESQKA